MLAIGNVVVKQEVLDARFACNLSACKGACCVEGDGGAPLEAGEAQLLQALLPRLQPFLSPAGLQALAQQGAAVLQPDGEWETPLVNGRECAYATFAPDGTALCGIEQAWQAGALDADFPKPVSCHLYPIREHRLGNQVLLAYHRWNICQPACARGQQQGLALLAFVRPALLRRFGAQFVQELDSLAERYGRQHSQQAHKPESGSV